MLFNAQFSKLEKRMGEKSAFYLAHSYYDLTPILFFEPNDDKLLETLDMLCEHNERLKFYDFKVRYKNVKTDKGSYQGYFNVIGFDSVNSSG